MRTLKPVTRNGKNPTIYTYDGAYFVSQVNNVCFHNEFSRDKVMCMTVMERNIRIAREIISK